MTCQAAPLSHEMPSDSAKKSLMTAALAGLMGFASSGCGSKVEEKIVTVEQVKGVVTSKTEKTYTLAEFEEFCKGRGGLVQFHASCGGVNSCKGVSYSYGKVREHSCKASNTCGGMSCVDLPQDQNRSGAELVQASGSGEMDSGPYCSDCHGSGVDKFKLAVAPNTDLVAAEAAFKAKNDRNLVASIAFGMHGVNSSGSAYANMPAFYQTYSRAEIERMVSFIRTLPLEVKNWQDPQ